MRSVTVSLRHHQNAETGWLTQTGHDVWSAGGYYFWIPMVAPFCGCVFGGVLYDFFIYTGPSPVNTAFFGLLDILHPKKAVKDRIKAQKQEGLV